MAYRIKTNGMSFPINGSASQQSYDPDKDRAAWNGRPWIPLRESARTTEGRATLMREYWAALCWSITYSLPANATHDEVDKSKYTAAVNKQAVADTCDLCRIIPEQHECNLLNARLYLKLQRAARNYPTPERCAVAREAANTACVAAMAELDQAASDAQKREAQRKVNESKHQGWFDQADRFHLEYANEMPQLLELLPVHAREAIDKVVEAEPAVSTIPQWIMDKFAPVAPVAATPKRSAK